MAGALARLFSRIDAAHGALDEPFDADWRSPCECGPADGAGRVPWRPVRRAPPGDFTGLERALGVAVHPDLHAFYTTYWAGCVPVHADEGDALLIQVWNDADFERLQANLIGHALDKRRARLALTAFVACTDEGELMLSVDNTSGEVVLENPGSAPQRTIARGLAEFLDRLTPGRAGTA